MNSLLRSAILIAVFLVPLQMAVHDADFYSSQENTQSISDVFSDVQQYRIVSSTASAAEAKMNLTCGPATPSSWFAGCLTPPFIFLGGTALTAGGAVFDFFLELTLNPSYYSAPYIMSTWVTMRDLANMVFIFGIIIVALLMITNGVSNSGVNWQETAKRLIIVALLLNFSLFFTQIFIDAGNIVGGFFHDQVLKNADSKTFFNPSVLSFGGVESPEAIKSVSATISSAVDPMKLIGPETIFKLSTDGKDQSFLFMFNIAYLFVTISVAWMLFKSGFMFLSRTIGLIILMIVSPLAFVAYFIPKGEQIAKMWFKNLINKSFCICVSLFSLFLLVKIIEGTANIKSLGEGANDWTMILIFTAINVMIVITILRISTSTTKTMCEGDTGGLGDVVMKTAVGAATLAGGFVGARGARAVIGGLGHRMVTKENGVISKLAASDGPGRYLGQMGLYAGDKLKNAKFGNKQSFSDAQQAGSKTLEASANRLTNLREAHLTEKYKEGEIARLKADYIGQGMNEEEAKKKAEIFGVANAAKLAKKEAREFGQKTLSNSSSVINFVMAGGVGGAGTEALKSYDKVDKDNIKQDVRRLENLESQRTFSLEMQQQEQAIERSLTSAIASAVQGEDIVKAVEEVKDRIIPAFQSRRIENGELKREILPNSPQETALNDVMKTFSTKLEAISQQTTAQQTAKDSMSSVAELEAILESARKHTEVYVQQGHAKVDELSGTDKQRLVDAGVKTNSAGDITHDDSFESMNQILQNVQEQKTQAAKEVTQTQKEIERLVKEAQTSVTAPVKEQHASEKRARAAISTADQGAVYDETAKSQEQVREGRPEDISRQYDAGRRAIDA